jgi:hypothetical protein
MSMLPQFVTNRLAQLLPIAGTGRLASITITTTTCKSYI